MDLNLIYRAVAAGEIDVTAGDATSGLIQALDLRILTDDREYFPPDHAVPVVFAATLLRHPEVDRVLRALAGRISAADMQRMNHAVDGLRQDPRDVAREFLAVGLSSIRCPSTPSDTHHPRVGPTPSPFTACPRSKRQFPQVASLPFSLKILLENLLRREDNGFVKADDIRALASWDPRIACTRNLLHAGARAAPGLHRRTVRRRSRGHARRDRRSAVDPSRSTRCSPWNW